MGLFLLNVNYGNLGWEKIFLKEFRGDNLKIAKKNTILLKSKNYGTDFVRQT